MVLRAFAQRLHFVTRETLMPGWAYLVEPQIAPIADAKLEELIRAPLAELAVSKTRHDLRLGHKYAEEWMKDTEIVCCYVKIEFFSLLEY